ncbi:reverse transcriptase domain-containing protein [Tanacetum coccineum]
MHVMELCVLVHALACVLLRVTFQRCMMAIFYDMIEKTMEVFMDDFLVFEDSFDSCLSNLEKMLKRFRDKQKTKHFQPIHYASKTMTEAQIHYTTTEKEMLAVVYAFEKFWPYLILSKSIVYTDHSALKYLMNKQDAKPSLFLPDFETPRAIISDRGTHFCNDQFAKVMFKYGVTHRLATAYHLKMSEQVEAFRTAFKTPIGCTPYKLVYGKSCHLPIKLEHKAYWALKHANFDLKTAGDYRKLQLNELNELRDQAYENSLIYKERTKKLHDSKIKIRIFNVGGDKFYSSNSV